MKSGKATSHVVGEIVPKDVVKVVSTDINSDETPNKKSKKDSAKGSVAQMNRASQLHPKTSIQRTEGNQFQDSILTLHLAQPKNTRTKGSIVR